MTSIWVIKEVTWKKLVNHHSLAVAGTAAWMLIIGVRLPTMQLLTPWVPGQVP